MQFHPEFDAGDSQVILRDFGAMLAADGLDLARAQRSIAASPDGPALLRRFAALAHGQSR